jgi:predicted house-cleaning NTP pyrophosphatase (Maf/HAM1 superfamily)
MMSGPQVAGAVGLMIEHPLVQQHVKSIEGSIDGIMGLSTLAFMRVLLKTVEDSNETPSQ